jgi:hypothetical protein
MTKVFPPAVLGNHTAILGKTGSGKTSTAKLAIEQLVAAGERVCIVDPVKSDHWGLTSSADGKRPGMPFQILGGPHGHVPLHDGAGAAIGELVATGALPLSILDLADFNPGGPARFFNAFANVLMRKMRGVVHLVIEEAHEFAPKERSGVGDENMSIYYAKKLATAGRSRGIRLIVCSQSVQQLHNRVLGSCETLIVHRFVAPADQAPVFAWLKGNVDGKEEQERVQKSLRRLADGQAWICRSGEPIELRQFPRIQTFDNSVTPDSQDAAAHVVTAKVDDGKLRQLIGAAVAEAEANDPAKLRAQIVELERQLKVAPKDFAQRAVEDYAAGKVDGERQGYEQGFADGRTQAFDEGIKAGRAEISEAVRGVLDSVTSKPVGVRPFFPAARAPSVTVTHEPPPRAPTSSPVSSSGSIAKGEAAVLQACLWHPEGVTRETLTVLTGYKKSSRDAYLQRLSSAGLIEIIDGKAVATTAGRRALPDAKAPPRGSALRAFWHERLPEGEWKLLDYLIQKHPREVSREELSDSTSYRKSSRDAYLQRLRARQLIEEPRRGFVKPSALLFA